MAVEYVNRMGNRYSLYQGQTRTGKPKFYMARKSAGVLVDAVPEGYEIYESPENAQVTLRRVSTSRIRPLEREQLVRWIRERAGTEYFLVDVEEDSLVVYTPHSDPAEQAERLSKIFGSFPGATAKARDLFAQKAQYCAMFRFTLVNEEERLFRIERWCFRGGIDNWFFLGSGQTLEILAQAYLPHLNRESFYDLM